MSAVRDLKEGADEGVGESHGDKVDEAGEGIDIIDEVQDPTLADLEAEVERQVFVFLVLSILSKVE